MTHACTMVLLVQSLQTGTIRIEIYGFYLLLPCLSSFPRPIQHFHCISHPLFFPNTLHVFYSSVQEEESRHNKSNIYINRFSSISPIIAAAIYALVLLSFIYCIIIMGSQEGKDNTMSKTREFSSQP